jgi:hypothetical protein
MQNHIPAQILIAKSAKALRSQLMADFAVKIEEHLSTF